MYKSLVWLALATSAGCSAPSSNAPPPTAGTLLAADTDAAPAVAASSDAPAAAASAAARGARIFSGNCSACHQQDARGIPGVYPSLVGSPVLLGDPQELALWVIQGRRPPSLPVGRYSTAMSQFGWMKAQDAAALFTYLRSHFGNSAPAVDAAVVAQALDR